MCLASFSLQQRSLQSLLSSVDSFGQVLLSPLCLPSCLVSVRVCVSEATCSHVTLASHSRGCRCFVVRGLPFVGEVSSSQESERGGEKRAGEGLRAQSRGTSCDHIWESRNEARQGPLTANFSCCAPIVAFVPSRLNPGASAGRLSWYPLCESQALLDLCFYLWTRGGGTSGMGNP